MITRIVLFICVAVFDLLCLAYQVRKRNNWRQGFSLFTLSGLFIASLNYRSDCYVGIGVIFIFTGIILDQMYVKKQEDKKHKLKFDGENEEEHL